VESPCWSRLVAGPMTTCVTHIGAVFCEGLHPVGKAHTRAVCEEWQPMGRTLIGAVHGELSPMGGTLPWSRGRE